ncbi:unnamed protein product, partial [Hapterophycus canaliculatus]
LEPKKLWEQLLFLDDQNYGGIQVQGSPPEDGDEDNESAENSGGVGETMADRKVPPIVSHWNLAEYLPASVRQVFLILVSTFLHKPHE